MRRIRTIILGGLCAIIFAKTYGQQDPQYTQYMYNMNVLNPAYAGSQGTLSIGLLGRTQWVGINGAPQTLTTAIHAPLGNRVGMGLSVIADQIGPVKEQNAYVDVSYTMETSYEGRLAFGLKGGVTFQNISKNLFYPDNEDILIDAAPNKTMPNFGAGVFYYTNKYYLGLSMPNILKSRHYLKESGVLTKATEKMHVFLTSGYVFDLNPDLKLKPSVMLKAVNGAPLSIDLSANALIRDKFEVGLSWREGDSVSGMVNFLFTPTLRVGYAYDYTLTNLSMFNSGSHEVFILYNLDLSRGDLNSPRFF